MRLPQENLVVDERLMMCLLAVFDRSCVRRTRFGKATLRDEAFPQDEVRVG
jgi:hypothetical protein